MIWWEALAIVVGAADIVLVVAFGYKFYKRNLATNANQMLATVNKSTD